jgi:hypothetical protein
MIYLNLKGGLGNQLFQIFACISYSLKMDQVFVFPNYDVIGNRSTYWNNFLSNLKKYTIFYNKIRCNYQIKENNFHYEKLPNIESSITSNFLFNGYFQSHKYFQDHYNLICNIIHVDEQRENIKIKYNIQENTISLHFRIGDYVKYKDTHPILSISYYVNAIQYIKKEIKEQQKINKEENHFPFSIIVFFQEEDEDIINNNISILQEKFPEINFIKRPTGLEDWEEMLYMSCCQHHIIANSTFSWWGAFFNPRQKIVCYPSKWFGNRLNHDTKDLFPENWIKIKKK